MKKLGLFAAFVFVFSVGCQQGRNDTSSPEPENEAAGEDVNAYVEQANEAIRALQSRLVEALTSAMKQGGPPSAVHVCRDEAQAITEHVSQEKGIDMLLQAFARLVVQRPQTVLMIVGRGPRSDTLQELARSLGIEGQVIFTGAVPYDQVPHYMAAADLFVFASTAETQGLVVIEALAAGTPVVAVHASGIDDVLAGSKGGVLVQDDEATFADTILSILARPDRIAEMRRAACETAQRYTISAATERLLAVYDRAMASGPRYPERSPFGIPRSNHSAGRR